MNVHERIKLFIKLLFSNEKELYSFCAHLTGFCPRGIATYSHDSFYGSAADIKADNCQLTVTVASGRINAVSPKGECSDLTIANTVGATVAHRQREACGAVHCLKFSNFPGLWQKNRIKFLSKDIIY